MKSHVLKAIKAKCLDCCCNQITEVRKCTINDCPLYEFRLGKDPYKSHEYTEEEKMAFAERMRKARSCKKL